MPLSPRGCVLATRVCYAALRRELPQLTAAYSDSLPSGAIPLLAPSLPDYLPAELAMHPQNIVRVVSFLREYHSAARQQANYLALALITLLLNMLSASSVIAFLPAERAVFEDLIQELNLLNASIRETRISDTLLSLTKETLVHLSTELVSLIKARKSLPKQTLLDFGVPVRSQKV
jgi:hypothetical protein